MFDQSPTPSDRAQAGVSPAMKPGSASFDLGGWLSETRPDAPVFLFDPTALTKTAARFRTGFPGRVTYAVKANPDPRVIRTLAAAGIHAFDVASPAEMLLVREHAPGAALHYHNPVRSSAEIAEARRHGIASWSVDRMTELDKLGALAGAEIAVRLRLPVAGAAYDFGAKFGADPDDAAALLRAVVRRGGTPALTFHPGTQCDAADAWPRYIDEAAGLARRAGVVLARLNVGGGFPSHRTGSAPDLSRHFTAIARAASDAFDMPPPLVCEPGRALVAEAMRLVLRVKALDAGAVVLNDGLYGALGDWRDMPASDRLRVIGPDGRDRCGAARGRTAFGPTCDSLDRLPEPLSLPADTVEGDWLVIDGLGAYAAALTTGFNGYGARHVVVVPGTGHPGATD